MFEILKEAHVQALAYANEKHKVSQMPVQDWLSNNEGHNGKTTLKTLGVNISGWPGVN